MTAARMLKALPWIAGVLPSAACAQVPDLLTAFDAGGRAMGAGGSFYATGIDTLSATYNPAGLAFAREKRFDVASHNYPRTKTTVTGSLTNMILSTKSFGGDQGLGHVGVVFPIQSGSGQERGSFSVSLTTAGWFDDLQTGSNLSGGIANYTDFTRAKTNLVTLAYGRPVGDKSFSYGFGLVYALQNVRNFQQINFSDNNIPPQISDTDDTGNGIGGLFGVLFTPTSKSNVSFGASLRTPINVRSNASSLALYNKIPGRVVIGSSVARDGLRRGKDSMIFGAQLQYFFDGQSSDRLDRKSSYATFGAGLEYGYAWGGGIIPLRLGYNWTPAGGNDFKQRSGMTYGIGYRPNKGDWTLDVNYARPAGGGHDMGLMFGYRFGG